MTRIVPHNRLSFSKLKATKQEQSHANKKRHPRRCLSSRHEERGGAQAGNYISGGVARSRKQRPAGVRASETGAEDG